MVRYQRGGKSSDGRLWLKVGRFGKVGDEVAGTALRTEVGGHDVALL